MKTLFASALVAASLFSAQAFASPETSHNDIPVMSTRGAPAVASRPMNATPQLSMAPQENQAAPNLANRESASK
ncbi:MAG: hypothetical protein LCH38_00325 [Proteobacteria bacterium]|nr:hypothetical protein [Pseudomonadota bacterium]